MFKVTIGESDSYFNENHKSPDRINAETLQETLGDISLTEDEIKSLNWLCGWPLSTVNNIVSAFKKAEQKRYRENDLPNECIRCQCNSCAFIDDCPIAPKGDDPTRPTPCIGCAKGMRFKPVEKDRCPPYERAE